MRYTRDTLGCRPEDFPNAGVVFKQIISLPIYPRMTYADVQDVIEAVRKIVGQYRR